MNPESVVCQAEVQYLGATDTCGWYLKWGNLMTVSH